jgi:hypothetical protein
VTTLSLIVTTDGERWTITHTTTALVTRTILVPAIYSVPEALLMAAGMTDGDVLWKVTEGPEWLGFVAVIHAPYQCSHGHTHQSGEACPTAIAMRTAGV